jgi:hypothetical protein
MNSLYTSRGASTANLPIALSIKALALQNRTYRGSGGVSAGNRGHGFRPAFLDQVTGTAYLSCFANGCAAPVHVLDGLPDELVHERNRQGKVMKVREGIIAGFLRDGVFYTREQAALALSH